MRARRTGDPTTVRRPGRAPDPERAFVKQQLEPLGWSDRTFERYWYAARWVLGAYGEEVEFERLVAEARRPDGSINVAKLATLADRHIVLGMDRHRDFWDPIIERCEQRRRLKNASPSPDPSGADRWNHARGR